MLGRRLRVDQSEGWASRIPSRRVIIVVDERLDEGNGLLAFDGTRSGGCKGYRSANQSLIVSGGAVIPSRS